VVTQSTSATASTRPPDPRHRARDQSSGPLGSTSSPSAGSAGCDGGVDGCASGAAVAGLDCPPPGDDRDGGELVRGPEGEEPGATGVLVVGVVDGGALVVPAWPFPGIGPLCARWRWACACRCSARPALRSAAGASASPAETGSEASPICWLARRLAAIATTAATTIPSSASPSHRTTVTNLREGG